MTDILLLEDDKAYRESIEEYLVSLGYEVESYENGSDALDALFAKSFKLALLDIRVPKMSGLEVLRAVREADLKTAVILVTSLTDIDDLSIGYELGCNDYIRKPFDLKELRYRVGQAIQAVSYNSLQNRVELKNGFVYDIDESLLFENGDEIELTKKEKEIISYLVREKNRWVDIEELRSEVWDMKEIDYTTIRMAISRIRNKCQNDLIENQRGLGYRVAI